LVLEWDLPRSIVLEKQVINPNYKVAFKMLLEEQIRKSKVINVDWNISRYGRYVPVAVYESVYIDGTRLHRATCHNASHVRDWSMGKGTQITIVRSGDVIPAIKDVVVDNSINPIFPPDSSSGGYDWHWDLQKQKDIYLNDIESNKQVQIARNLHFFQTIGVAKLGEKTIEKLWLDKKKTAESIIKMKKQDLLEIKGIGDKTATTIFTNIHNALKTTSIDRLVSATTTALCKGLGRKLIKVIVRTIPNIFSLDETEIINHLKNNKIKGIGPKRIKTVAECIPFLKTYLYNLDSNDIQENLDNYVKKMTILKIKGYDKKIQYKNFVFSGFMGDPPREFEDYIYDNFGDISSTVTSGTEAVIVANVTTISKKMTDAANLKVLVYTVEEFSDKFGITLKNKDTKIYN